MSGLINGKPTKQFFIGMLTRDISIRDAILDLLDNSIDGASNISKTNYTGLQIKITVNKNEFIVEDNCGGFSLETAIKYAFRFGRPDEMLSIGGTIGRFGVGMKRALFKMGQNFEIESKSKSDHFQIDVDVESWKNKKEIILKADIEEEVDDWNFDYVNIDSGNKDLNSNGTYIRVSNLYPEVSEAFDDDEFLNSLESDIEKLLNFSLEKGLKIILNDKVLSKKDIIIFTDITEPYYAEGVKNKDTNQEVKYKIIAGLSHTGKPIKSGWYIYCNDRLVVEADKSEITGWGVGSIPSFNNDYAMFKGVLFLDSDDPINLPLTTTKKGIDATSDVYKTVLGLMKEGLQHVLAFLKQVQKLEDSQEYRISLGELQDEEEQITIVEMKSKSFDEKRKFIPPPIDYNKVIQKKDTVRISFIANRNRAEAAKKHNSSSSYTQLGSNIFEYYFKMEELDNE